MSKVSRRFQFASTQVEKKLYNYIEAISLLKKIASAKFTETVEAHIVLGLDPTYADQQLRSTVILPKGIGKNIKVVVIAQGDNLTEALLSGADIVGSEDIIDQIAQGFLDFDKLIATPDMMPSIAKLGRILGPRGLMPSPKAGTVTINVGQAVKEFKLGKVEYKIDKTGILHVPFGRVNFSVDDLGLNLFTLQESINKNRPSGSKGKYLKTLNICSTMGPAIQIDISSLNVQNI